MGELETHAEAKKKQIAQKAQSWKKSTIDRVAMDLERYNYDPGIFFPVPDFPYYRAEDMAREIDRILEMDEEEVAGFSVAQDRSVEEVKRIAIDMLTSQFFLVERLRAGEPEAWDEIHELYEDD
jgi:hypothetical protein